jgi:hypothetical protein
MVIPFVANPPQNGSLAVALKPAGWADLQGAQCIDVPVALRAWTPTPEVSGAFTSLALAVKGESHN